MLHSTASATAAGKVEADVLLTFQIIPLIPIWDLGRSIRRERPVRIHPRRQNRKFDPTWKSGSVMRASSTKAFPLPPSHGAFLSSFPLARLGRVWQDGAILWVWTLTLEARRVFAVTAGGSCWHMWSVLPLIRRCTLTTPGPSIRRINAAFLHGQTSALNC